MSSRFGRVYDRIDGRNANVLSGELDSDEELEAALRRELIELSGFDEHIEPDLHESRQISALWTQAR